MKTDVFTEHEHVPRTWTDILVQRKQWEKDIPRMLGASSLGTIF